MQTAKASNSYFNYLPYIHSLKGAIKKLLTPEDGIK